MLQWLEQELKVSSNAFRKLKADTAKLEALRPRPTLAVAQANVAALEEVLHMSTPQVLSGHTCDLTACTLRFRRGSEQQRIATHRLGLLDATARWRPSACVATLCRLGVCIRCMCTMRSR